MRRRYIVILAVALAGAAALSITAGCGGEPGEADLAVADAARGAQTEDAHAECDHDADHEDSHADSDHDASREHVEAEVPCAHEAQADGHDDHDGHDHADDASIVRLTERELTECGVTMNVAGPGWLARRVVLPGEVRINDDNMVHMVPRVPGIVRQVRKSLGDEVKAGEILAVIESNDLADARVDYLAARERLALAESNYGREENLWQKKITSEQEYLDARSELTEARIELRSSEQKLYALGLTKGQVENLAGDGDDVYTRYEIRAPFAGTVVDKHCTLGEKVGDESEIFQIADLSTVWVDLSVTQKDFPYVREGVEVSVSAGYGIPDTRGRIDYVSPVVGQATRTATARIVLANADGQWRPGLFVSATIAAADTQVPVMIPRTAAQHLDEEWVVFVEADGGFEPVPVTIGRSDEDHLEVLAGLEPGQRYVAEGAFECKAKIVTSGMDPHAGHGH